MQQADEVAGEIDVRQGEGGAEEGCHLLGGVAGDAAADGGDEEGEFGVLAGTVEETADGGCQGGGSFHGGQGVGLSLQTFALSEHGAEASPGEEGGTSAVHSLDVAAKDENLSWLQLADAVGGDAESVFCGSVGHGEF